MIDTPVLLSQVLSNQTPLDWQVWRAKASYFYGIIGFAAFLIVASVAAAIYLLFSGEVFGYGISSDSSDGVLLFWQIVDYLVLLAIIVVSIIRIISQGMALGQKDQQVLALLPDGFLLRKGTKPNQLVQVDFRTVSRLTTSTSNGTLYLMVARKAGGTLKVALDSRFGPPKTLANTILAAYGKFATSAAA